MLRTRQYMLKFLIIIHLFLYLFSHSLSQSLKPSRIFFSTSQNINQDQSLALTKDRKLWPLVREFIMHGGIKCLHFLSGHYCKENITCIRKMLSPWFIWFCKEISYSVIFNILFLSKTVHCLVCKC